MDSLEQERLVVITLDTKNCFLSQEPLYIGNANTSVVRVSEIFRPAIILSHNHPSGDPSPSERLSENSPQRHQDTKKI